MKTALLPALSSNPVQNIGAPPSAGPGGGGDWEEVLGQRHNKLPSSPLAVLSSSDVSHVFARVITGTIVVVVPFFFDNVVFLMGKASKPVLLQR